jgi:ATP-dependent Clp protease ATP-binding subunit ClpA
MTTFDTYVRSIHERGADEARKEASATIEAHHLLLAIAAEPEPSTQEILTSAGLDYRAIRAALDREFEHSLSAAGVSRAAADLPRPQPSSAPEHPKPGSSFKLAMERGVASAARKRDLRPAHLLLGIMEAQVGTVPRALALAGIDRADLRARVQRSLATEG